MLKNLLPIIMIITLTGCHGINQRLGLRDDNPIEQGIERTIQEHTGAQVDLTPEEREKLGDRFLV